MRFRSVLRSLVALAALCTTMAAVPVQAATFTFSNDNCASFNWDSVTNTLTCVAGTGGSTAPSGCQAHASPTSVPQAGGTVALSVTNCSGSCAS